MKILRLLSVLIEASQLQVSVQGGDVLSRSGICSLVIAMKCCRNVIQSLL